MKKQLIFLACLLSLLFTHSSLIARPLSCIASNSSSYPPFYFPSYCHWITALSAIGDSLEIEDGSIWKIDPSNTSDARYWKSVDPLFLTQNRSWFSSYQYRLMNAQTGESIGVNLFLGPVLSSEYLHLIDAIDWTRRAVTLNDGSCWEICPRDLDLFSEWVLDDCIFIGLNSGWDSFYDSILINSNMNQHVRARQF